MHNEPISSIHIPVSDVFYAQVAIREKLGIEVNIYALEQVMIDEGFLTPAGNPKPTAKDREIAYKRYLKSKAKKAGVFREKAEAD